MYLFLILITLLFIIYTEYNVTNILFRLNSKGNKAINISSLINFMLHPLHNHFLWNLNSLDINYIFVLVTSILLYNIYYLILNNNA